MTLEVVAIIKASPLLLSLPLAKKLILNGSKSNGMREKRVEV